MRPETLIGRPEAADKGPSAAAPAKRRKHAIQPGAYPQADRGNNIHETPSTAIQALMRAESLPHRIWEPAAGPGAIARELRAARSCRHRFRPSRLKFPAALRRRLLKQTKAPEYARRGPPTFHRISTGNGASRTQIVPKYEKVETMVKSTNSKPEIAAANVEKVAPLKIVKPTSVFERFKSKKPPTIGGVGELLQALPLLKISDANDFVRLSPASEHWSPEMCFVAVPVHGEKRDILHFIDEEIAVKYLPAKKIKRFRLALASKPYDNFFLAIVPTVNLENSWNSSMVAACEQAKTHWVQVSSRKAEGKETYKIDLAQDVDAFPDPKWPGNMETLVEVSFNGFMIETEDHAALRRLIGRKQNLA